MFERDNYTCKRCDERGGMLNAHHVYTVKAYPEVAFDIDNIKTVCDSCHGWLHKTNGYVYVPVYKKRD